MNISIKDIDIENWEECTKLKVSREQERYLPHSNLKSIAESRFYPNYTLLGIYKDDKIIGFAMHGEEDEDKMAELRRFMIDEKYQGNGYGRKALALVLEDIKKKSKYKTIYLSFHPKNIVTKNLYSSFGFKQFITGFEAEDEIFYKKEI
ncbi:MULTISPECIES: GNAT family N-acetyltransferase [unclassified Clostridium]|uniref:GNAT family N-acetyltransferase n=1 Tax=unclassified Clostridium TaxID=2614128 RepID=UPI003217C750